MSNFSAHRSRGVVVLAAAAVLAVSAGSGAVAGSMITGEDIKNRSIQAQDLDRGAVTTNKVENRTLKLKDLSDEVTSKLGVQGPAGKDGAPGAPGKDGAAGKDGVDGTNGVDGTDGLLGAKYRTLTYLNGGSGSATVACADNATESQKYTAIAGGVRSASSTFTQADGFAVTSSFPGRINWNTGEPLPNRLDGWIVFGNGVATDTLVVWALCVPNTSIPVDAGTL